MRLPTHLAIIMDGNGRWAKQRNLPRSEGHRAGTEAARAVITESRKLGISYLTLYTFSKENWKRPREEITFLFDLLVRFLTRELKTLKKQSIRLNVVGNIQDLPFAARKTLKTASSQTASCSAMTLNLALNYSGRQDIVDACKSLMEEKISPEEITEESFKGFLYTQDQPDPDLIIRTSGEQRLSNFLLYQAAYSELYFTEALWPDFKEEELHKALKEFEHRERRYGDIE